MELIKKYRVRVVVNNHMGLNPPTTEYVIQKRWGPFWLDENDSTSNKEWAYQTCEEMNMPYNEAKNKS